MIDLYTAATPNGHKVSIALEELGLARLVVQPGILAPARENKSEDQVQAAQSMLIR